MRRDAPRLDVPVEVVLDLGALHATPGGLGRRDAGVATGVLLGRDGPATDERRAGRGVRSGVMTRLRGTGVDDGTTLDAIGARAGHALVTIA